MPPAPARRIAAAEENSKAIAQCDRFVEQMVIFKQIGEARHRLMEQSTNLHHQSGALLDQVVPVTRDGLQRLIDLSDRQDRQAIAFDRRVEDRFQIVVVGLSVGMQRSAVMVRRERMHDARVEPRLAERSLDRLVIDAGHLDGHDRVGQAFGPASLRHQLRHRAQSARGMLHARRFDQDLAVEVAQHPFRAAFGAVHRDDAEVLRSHRLNSLLDLAGGLADESLFSSPQISVSWFS